MPMIMKIEKIISEMLRKFPKLRNNIKLFYQKTMYLISKIINSNYENMAELKCVTRKTHEHFFGYYDKSPWDISNRYILSLKVPYSDKHPNSEDKADIVLIDSKEKKREKVLAFITTWNLQQGCMLQWLGPDFDEKIIYNNMINNKYVSIILNINNNKKKIINRPIYSVSKDGNFALALNFSRLHRLRPGYGYSNLPDKTESNFYPEGDGIWYIDLNKNESKLIISLKEIVEFKWDRIMKGTEHRFNHIDINPSGTRFSFLHRWEYKNETYSRLFTANTDGSDIYCLADDKMVSHSCWKNNEQILVWCRQDKIGDRYFLFTDKSNKKEIIGEGILTVDGHPSYSPDGRYILTDTYPDRARMRSLIVYDTETNKRYDIARVFAPFKYDGEVRCDLHPRWNRDGSQICFDSVHEGKRQLYIVDNPLFNCGDKQL